MIYDEIIVGSGLTSLATLLGLKENKNFNKKRILVLADQQAANIKIYNSRYNIPYINSSYGGLGNFWHGVIPLNLSKRFPELSKCSLIMLLKKFYPNVHWDKFVERKKFFVPWFPIRPKVYFQQLSSQSSNLNIQYSKALVFRHAKNKMWQVITADCVYTTNRLWLCGGTLGTAELLDRSGYESATNEFVSDHFITYVGQILKCPYRLNNIVKKRYSWQGYIFDPMILNHNVLVTARPAFLDYKRLDFGIAQRQNFGLPVSGILGKLVRCKSPGLLCEAIFNKFGLMSASTIYNIYAQHQVPNVLERKKGVLEIKLKNNIIKFHELKIKSMLKNNICKVSKKAGISFPAIHLHNSVHKNKLIKMGIAHKNSNLQIQDASVIKNIGPEHHIFRVMATAFRNAVSS